MEISISYLGTMTIENNRLKENLVYLLSQSMRNNLIFCNVPESRLEKSSETESKLRVFMEEKLQLAHDFVSQLKLEHVHRIGPAQTQYPS